VRRDPREGRSVSVGDGNIRELGFKEIIDRLEHGETVKLSSVGSFVARSKGIARMGRNPKTGKEVSIAPRRVMVFKPSAIVRQRLARADEVIE
jgi:integration host factor subunit alpha